MKKSLTILFLVIISSIYNAQNNTNSSLISDTLTYGVAVAPSSMRFDTKVGESQTRKLYITNSTNKSYKFRINFQNVNMDRLGDITQETDSDYEYGLTKWISASPNFLELEPREKAIVNITVNVPEGQINKHAAWCMGMVDQVTERTTIADLTENITFGVIPSFGFGVYFYQNPPDLKINDVEILDFNFNYTDDNKYISMVAENRGKGIAKAKVYIELNDLGTGYYEKLDLKVFNILPGRQRDFNFSLPGSMPKGRYSIMGVLDFGSDEEIKAASKEIIIQ
tara:strand:+ start:331 stop:1173 length:843 start_codon:yes stop_codon:yes gene_type:complete